MLPLSSQDWGEANKNPMVRAYGKKKGARSKCQSCAFCMRKKNNYYTCYYRYPVEHDRKYIACQRYVNKSRKGMIQIE